MAAAVAGWAAISAGSAAGVVTAVSALGLIMLLVAVVFRRPALVTVGVAAVGLGCCLSGAGGPVGGQTALQATALLAAAELAFWSIDLHGTGPGEPGGHQPGWIWIGKLLVASVLVTGGLGVVAVAVSPTDFRWMAAAAVAAVAVVALLAVLARGLSAVGEGPACRVEADYNPLRLRGDARLLPDPGLPPSSPGPRSSSALS